MGERPNEREREYDDLGAIDPKALRELLLRSCIHLGSSSARSGEFSLLARLAELPCLYHGGKKLGSESSPLTSSLLLPEKRLGLFGALADWSPTWVLGGSNASKSSWVWCRPSISIGSRVSFCNTTCPVLRPEILN